MNVLKLWHRMRCGLARVIYVNAVRMLLRKMIYIVRNVLGCVYVLNVAILRTSARVDVLNVASLRTSACVDVIEEV